jgi:hypothetical protein
VQNGNTEINYIVFLGWLNRLLSSSIISSLDFIKNSPEDKVADPGFRALGFCVQLLYGGDWRPEERENGKRASK